MLPSINQLIENCNLEPFHILNIIDSDISVNSTIMQKSNIDVESDSDMSSYPQSPLMSDSFCIKVENEQQEFHQSTQHKEHNHKSASKKKTEFTEEEDIKLIKLVNLIGKNNWFVIGQMMGTKTGRQCKDRWMHYLNPKGNLNTWTLKEDCQLIQLYAQYGHKWQKISQHITGRTCNSIRNR